MINGNGWKLLTLDEVAKTLGLHRETVKGYISWGKLTAIKLGYRTLRVEPEELEKFIASRERSC